MYCCKQGSQPSTKILRGAGNNRLKVVGQAMVNLCLGEKEIQELVYFVEGLLMPLLEKPVIGRLDLIRFVDGIGHSECHDWQKVYPNLFHGLGAMSTEVRIQIKKDALSFVQVVPRRIAAARKQSLYEELCQMEKLGVIEQVERPTE